MDDPSLSTPLRKAAARLAGTANQCRPSTTRPPKNPHHPSIPVEDWASARPFHPVPIHLENILSHCLNDSG